MILSLSVALQLRIPASEKVFTPNHGQIKVRILLVSCFKCAEKKSVYQIPMLFFLMHFIPNEVDGSAYV